MKANRYNPYGAARAVWQCKDPEVLCDGPAGTGKTVALLQKGHIFAGKYGGSRVLLVRKTRASLTEAILVHLEQLVLIDQDGETLPWAQGLQRATRRIYEYPNGSCMAVAGMDLAGRIMSTQWDLILVFEATELTEDDWEMLTTRLRNGKAPYQQIIADCNPASPSHWLKRRADAGKMTRFQSRHEDNPRLYDGTAWTAEGKRYLSLLDSLSGHRRERLRFGKWAAAEGLVYPDWNEAVNVIREMPAGWKDWRKFRVIDFGLTNPFVCQWWAVDGDGRAYLYREIYKTQKTVWEHAKNINRLSAGEQYEATIADHDAEDRATLLSAGISTIPANKAISPGIQAVSARVAPDATGRPRLFVLANALVEVDRALDAAKKPTSTLAEFDNYIWPKGADGRMLKEAPVKEHDHGMDAMRYMVAHLDCRTTFGSAIGVPTARDAGDGDELSPLGWVGDDSHMWERVV